MCPDTQLHSAFYDGEIPAPWNAQFAAHAENCPECSAKLASYRKITESLKKAEPECPQDFLADSFSRLVKRLETADTKKQKTAPAGFISINTLKVAVAAVFVAAILPATFLLGKITAERELNGAFSYYTLMQSQQKSNVSFPPQQNVPPLEFTIAGRQTANATHAVPVFEPGRGIVVKDSGNQNPMIIIRLPNPDFSPFAEETTLPVQEYSHK